MMQPAFRVKWRHWISACLGFAGASVLVNGGPTCEFTLIEVFVKVIHYRLVIMSMEGLYVVINTSFEDRQ